MSNDLIQEYQLPTIEKIEESILSAFRPEYATPGATIKVYFMNAAPAYEADTFASFLHAYSPENEAWATTPPPVIDAVAQQSYKVLLETFETVRAINASFNTIPDSFRAGAFENAINIWAKYGNFSIEMTTNEAEANIRIGFAEKNVAIPLNVAVTGKTRYDVYVNSSTPGVFAPGVGKTANLIHEFGHALGLIHPSIILPDPHGDLPAKYESLRYSVMNYGFADPQSTSNKPITPMIFDIIGLQSIFGLKSSVESGKNTYTL